MNHIEFPVCNEAETRSIFFIQEPNNEITKLIFLDLRLQINLKIHII